MCKWTCTSAVALLVVWKLIIPLKLWLTLFSYILKDFTQQTIPKLRSFMLYVLSLSLMDTQQTQLPALLESDLPVQQTFYVWTDMYWWCGSSCLEMDNVTIAVVLLRLPGNCHCSLTHVSVSILVCSQPLFLCVCCFPNGLMDLTSSF